VRIPIRVIPILALAALALRVVACSNSSSPGATSGGSGSGGGAGGGTSGAAGAAGAVLPNGDIVGGPCPCYATMEPCFGPDLVGYHNGHCATQPDGASACVYSPASVFECDAKCGAACTMNIGPIPFRACTDDTACASAPPAAPSGGWLGNCGILYDGACVSGHCHWKYTPKECPGDTAGGMWGGGGFAGSGGAGKSGGGNGGNGGGGSAGGPPQTCTDASQCLVPPTSCDGNNLVFWTTPVCMGICSFTMHTEPCAGICMGGQCIAVDGGADGG
jgi:hypothetical protein